MILHEAGGHRLRAAIISVVLAVGAYAALALWSDAAKFAQAARSLGMSVGISILALSALNYALRSLRWRFFLARLGHELPWRSCAVNYVSGFALTTTPGKAGEAIRSMLLKRRFGIAVTDSLAAFFAERFSDVLALALLCALALAFLPYGAYVAAGVVVLVALALWIAAADARTARVAHGIARVLPHRYAAPLASLIGQAGRLTRGGALATGFALSLAAWAAGGMRCTSSSPRWARAPRSRRRSASTRSRSSAARSSSCRAAWEAPRPSCSCSSCAPGSIPPRPEPRR